MEKYIRKLGKNAIIISMILIACGLFMVANPIGTVSIIMILFGCLLVISGLIHLISYFSINDEYRFFSSELAQAIIYIILGFVLVCNYDNISTLLPIILGIWIIVESIYKLQISLNIRDIYDSHWGILFAMSIITGLLGMVILFNPFASLALFIRIAGVVVVIVELIYIFEDFSIISQVGKIEKFEKELNKKMKK